VEDKFRYVTGPVISDGRQAALISVMRNVESIKSVREISDLIVMEPERNVPVAAQ
jgi:hypothetical protein